MKDTDKKIKKQEPRKSIRLRRHSANVLKKAKKAVKKAKRSAIDKKLLLQQKLFVIARRQRDTKKWYKLDNAALMYPLVARGESISVFRLAVQLYDEVDPITLQLAVNDVFCRFPSICGCVKNGFFWPYIDKPTVPLVVKEQTKVPGRPMPVDSRRSQIRVNYFSHQIAVEFFHSATDGTGGLIFLNSLLRCYFARLGTECGKTNCLDHRDTPTVAELRDNFANIAVAKDPPPLPPIVKSKRLCGTVFKNKKYVTMKGVCSASQLHALAKSYGASVTDFLSAVQMLSLDYLCKNTNNKDPRPIRVLIPVNLRRLYDVETIRNFSSYIFYQYNGQKDVSQILDDIAQQKQQQLTDDYFRGMVSYNYNSGNNPALKIVPLAIKKLVLKAIVRGRGDGIVNCSTLSNLGVISAPPEFADKVIRYEFMLGKPARGTNNFTAATYKDVCVISVTNIFAEKDCERFFFKTLADMGLDIAVESDIWEEAE